MEGQKRYSLSAKIITVIFVAILCSTVLVGWLVYNSGKAELILGIKDSLEGIASTASLFIDGDIHESITSVDSEGYRAILATLLKIQKINKMDAALSTLKKAEKRHEMQCVVTTEAAALLGATYKMQDGMETALSKGVTTSTDIYESNGTIWISAYAPIRNSKGKVVALLKAQRHAAFINENLIARIITVVFFCTVAFIVALLLSLFLIKQLTANIEKLDDAAAALGKGDYDTPINIDSADEIGELARTLDTMRVSLNENIKKISHLWLKEKSAHLESILTLSRAIEIRDPYTRGHVERVSHYSMVIAGKLGLSGEEMEELKYGCMLHDLGKLGGDMTILEKTTALNDEEKSQVKMHTIYGAEILKGIQFLNTAREISLYHHERYDGSGYPFGLKGDKIPLAARIVSLADAFDAMTSDRPYRKKLDDNAAFAILSEEAGKQFDPYICRLFIESRDEILKIRDRYEPGKNNPDLQLG